MKGEIDSFSMEKQYKRIDGSQFWAKITRSLIHIQNEKYIVGFIEDIDVQKSAQIALQKKELKYRSLFENGFDGILIFDINSVSIKEVNQKLIKYFKLNSAEEFLQRDVLGFSPKYQPNGISSKKALEKIIERTTEEDNFEFKWLHELDDGTQLYTSVYTFKNKDNPHLYTSIFKDITETTKQEETIKRNLEELNIKNKELQKYIESNMQLENFAYVASHDLKGPIRTMVSFSQLLSRSAKEKLNPDESDYLNFIIKATKNMELLINDLLMYSRADTQKIQIQSLDLNQIFEDIFYELKTNIDDKNVSIEINGIPSTIYADRTRIRQLFQNLISNAIKFSVPEKQPFIKVSCFEKIDHWNFTIEDNGIGIDKEYHNKIFLLFKKLHSNEVYEGSGIGLALCKKIVNQHQGKIWLTSEKNVGTTFHLTLSKTIQ